MSMTIGIDPHKGSHTAVAIDGDEHPVARLTVTADRCQTERLLAWAEPLGIGVGCSERLLARPEGQSSP